MILTSTLPRSTPGRMTRHSGSPETTFRQPQNTGLGPAVHPDPLASDANSSIFASRVEPSEISHDR